jgi:hypothetical protein
MVRRGKWDWDALKKGKRLATLKQEGQSPTTSWQEVRFSKWYGHSQRTMLLVTNMAFRRRSDKVVLPVRGPLTVLLYVAGELHSTLGIHGASLLI